MPESPRMLCPHCRHQFHDNEVRHQLTRAGHSTGWHAGISQCANCQEYTIDLITGINSQREKRLRSHPQGTTRPPVPVEVLSEVAQIYTEACAVLPLSTRASAALSRRCIQQILHAHGYKRSNLDQEIQALLKESDPTKAIPGALRETVDAIRNFGNFGAHPMTDVTSLQVIDVEPEEAEWCLEILETMFQHFYVAPAAAKARKAALDTKLKAAGKPPSK